MYEYFWFSGLMALSVWFSWKAAEHDTIETGQWQVSAHCAAAMAVILSWSRIGNVVLEALRVSLPQPGTPGASLAAVLITALLCAVAVLGAPLGLLLFFHDLAAKKHNRKR